MLRTTTCLILLAFGCATEATLGETEQGVFHDIQPPGDDCESWGCGSNSPIMATYRFWDLPETSAGASVVNAQGFRITDYQKSGTHYRVDVVNDRLVGRSTLWPYSIVLDTSAEVVGSVFSIDNVETGEKFQMIVAEVGRTALFVHPQGRNVMTQTYRLQWRMVFPQVGHFEDLCGASVDPDGLTPFHAVLFADDQIDTATIQYVGTRSNWFNIGCKGHTLAKQHLLGHTNAAAALIGNGWNTPPNARTSNLKMLTADYCGSGNPFTIAGEAIQFRDVSSGYNTVPAVLPPGAQVESRWRAGGAICLNTPRVDVHHPNGVQDFDFLPVESWITMPNKPWCVSRPPPCTGWMADPNNMSGTDIVTVVQ